jgi:hypothetical protein
VLCGGRTLAPLPPTVLHRAADWKEQVWVGKLQVVSRGSGCAVKLISEGGKIFAVAPVRRDGPPAVEKVSDSSRYFALRIENDKGAAGEGRKGRA